jgi:hypothetical protein
MLAVVAAILLAISFFERGAGAGHVSAWFGWQGTMVLGLFFLALHLAWPWAPWQRPPR